MQFSSRLTASALRIFQSSSNRKWIIHHSRQLSILHQSQLFSKFDVRDTITDSAPLTKERAYDLLVSLNGTERLALRTALEKFEAQKIKEGFEGTLAKTRWRSKFGRPAKMPALGEVDPTGTYCAVPDDWLKKKMVFLINAVPFLGFGFLDNFTMIIAGDYIESLFGMFMCISTMAAAALGNTISDILGIGSAYYIEKLSELMGLRPPKLTQYQFDMPSCRRAANSGRLIGITVGCIIGMTPLLFMDNKKKKDDEENTDPAETVDVAVQ